MLMRLLLFAIAVACGSQWLAVSAATLTHNGAPAVGLYGPNRYDGIPDDCLLPMEFGYCRAKVKRYYFDVRRMKCAMFYWGGCAGNLNNFKSMDECNEVCFDAYEEEIAQSQVGQRNSGNSNYNSNANSNSNNNNNNYNANPRTGGSSGGAAATSASLSASSSPASSPSTGGFSKLAVDKGSHFKSYLNKFNQRANDNNANTNLNVNNNNNNNSNKQNDNSYAASETYDDADAEEVDDDAVEE